ncbi:hypothetical protein HS088_TW08G00071 [Tripterygium wilfordii]|uniref:Uncharacterized protein n=1 Tax=Tripterygium wilfordii TaxID=458696 RepID=A0A7J7DAV1_TRIWF|nr:hypothetical protein HS088_TW08G00071 [Tripterygium wilfordii]
MSNFINHQRKCSVSISMPSSPIQDHEKSTKRVLFGDGIPVSTAESGVQPKKVKFHSQPMPRGSGGPEPVDIRGFPQHPGIKKFRDKRFDSFKTWSGKLERQISNIRGKPREPEPEPERGNVQKAETESIPVARYFDALQGPELETLRVILFFEAVRREYYHPIRVNFFFAPWISLLFLAIGVPPSVTQHLPPALWYVLMAPILCLELKIYGQWMSGGQRRLSKVANPSNHLSVVGNFVGALLGASMGLKEGPIFFFAVGLAHYAVLFVTLYQRLPTNATLPKELHPVFFLFVAAPSVASMAWARIQGSFDYGSRIAYFTALFLYFSLVSFT